MSEFFQALRLNGSSYTASRSFDKSHDASFFKCPRRRVKRILTRTISLPHKSFISLWLRSLSFSRLIRIDHRSQPITNVPMNKLLLKSHGAC